MLRRVLLLFFCFVVLLSARSQTLVGERARQDMISKIEKAAAGMKTMQCEFVQEKKLGVLNDKLISKGRMYYMAGNMLRWEYTSPYSYIFIINNNKVIMKNAKRTDVIDVNSSKLFKEIARIMMSSVTGKCLSDSKSFQVKMYQSEATWIAKLTPVKKEMKQMFSLITLHVDPKKNIVTQVELTEKSGDVCTITLNGIKTNAAISNKVFTLN